MSQSIVAAARKTAGLLKRRGMGPIPNSILPVEGKVRRLARDLTTIGGIALQQTGFTRAAYEIIGSAAQELGPALLEDWQSYRVARRVAFNGVENPREFLIQAIEGLFTGHLLVAFSKKKIAKQLLSGPVDIEAVVKLSSGTVENRRNIIAGFAYLERLGLVVINHNLVSLTPAGSYVFNRIAAFGVPHSYSDYARFIEEVLFGDAGQLHVARGPNVLGSGANHGKYFEQVREFISQTSAAGICDIGCGSGEFLVRAAHVWRPDLELAGFDLEQESLAVTAETLRLAGIKALLGKGNVKEPQAIAEKLREGRVDPNELLYTVWFIFHEVLRHEGVTPLSLLNDYYTHLGCRHGLVFCEIFDIPAEILLQDPHSSVAAAYTFFHAISGQKLISLAVWQEAIAQSPFNLVEFHPLDFVGGWNKTPYAGVFVLVPKESS